MISLLSNLVWPAIVVLPLSLTFFDTYQAIFPSSWYDLSPKDYWSKAGVFPSPLGLSLGLLAVVVGQFFVLFYFMCKRTGYLGQPKSIQKEGPRNYETVEGIWTHLAQPEGFVMLGGYLIITWMFGCMPSSYYSFSGGINWLHVISQLLLQDCIQYGMHLVEHYAHPVIYKLSHKPHHRFTNPRLFDAFNGSPTDTFVMIIIPLFCTARLVNANVWSYMAFGSLYANWLTLIHSEYYHSWEYLFSIFGLGTAADHHVHHKLFKHNFGHLFMYWDRLCGTYKSPKTVSLFNSY